MYTCLPKQKSCYRKQLQTCMSNQIKIISDVLLVLEIHLLPFLFSGDMQCGVWGWGFWCPAGLGVSSSSAMEGQGTPPEWWEPPHQSYLPSFSCSHQCTTEHVCLRPVWLVSWSVGIKGFLIFIVHQNCLLGAQVLRLCVCLCVALVPWSSLFVWSAFQFPI